MILDFVHLGKCTVLAFFGAKHVVDVFVGNAISHKRPLKIHTGNLSQATTTRELFNIPEVSHACWGAVDFGFVIGWDGGPGNVTDVAVGEGALNKVFCSRRAVRRRRPH